MYNDASVHDSQAIEYLLDEKDKGQDLQPIVPILVKNKIE